MIISAVSVSYLDYAGDEYWLINQPEGVILYAPLRAYVAVLNHNRVLKVEGGILSDDVKGKVRSLFEHKERIEKDILMKLPSFCDLSIAISNKCNLRCKYCHANAGESNEQLDIGAIKSSIDYLIDRCNQSSSKLARIQFAGGGEPTLHMDIIEEAVSYLRERCREHRFIPEVGMATNGMYNEQVADKVIEFFNGVSLSLDGPKDIMDLQRPSANGSSSYDTVYSTAKYFTRKKFPFALRATISSATLNNVDSFFSYFEREFPGISVGLEPLNPQGRGKEMQDLDPPADEEFARFLAEAYRRSLSGSFQFRNSTIGKFDLLRVHFCMSIAQPALTILPNRSIVACSRDNAPDIFSIGYLDEHNHIILNHESMQKIQGMNVLESAICQDCFCKYNCGGGCLDLRLSDNLRCDATRNIGLLFLRSKLNLPID